MLPDLSGVRLEDITKGDVQALADRLLASGLQPSTIRNALMPLRAICRHPLVREVVAVNPTIGIELPRSAIRRDRIAAPQEAADLLVALCETDRALWATALYAGLRAGELQGLAWEHVDLGAGLIRVERAWDPKNRVMLEPKSRADRRRVPIIPSLRDLLVEHKMRGDGAGLVWQSRLAGFFNASALRSRALSAWKKHGLAPIGLHEARHTYASLMIAAGVNAKALSA